MEKHKIISAVHLFLIDNTDRVLLSRRFKTGYEDGNYSLIAGHLERNETIKQAMVREAKEEAGIDIELSDLKVVHVMHRKAENETELSRIDFFLKTTKWNGNIEIKEKEKCDDMRWFDLDELPKNIIPYIKKSILEFSSNLYFSEYGWE
ncbi:NUDIX domain-containing protein [uncultured Croceitalea sp.]|uniref:NUDIX hydrolase n=1 Tax=uncultured Croceitalea sp. TaxID=1798908 RepID=UPI003305B5AC